MPRIYRNSPRSDPSRRRRRRGRCHSRCCCFIQPATNVFSIGEPGTRTGARGGKFVLSSRFHLKPLGPKIKIILRSNIAATARQRILSRRHAFTPKPHSLVAIYRTDRRFS